MSRARLATSLGALLSVASAASVSSASETAPVELRYVRERGAERCPDEETLRQAVRVRLGYDPFVAVARRVVSVTLSRRGPRMSGRIDDVDAEGRVVGTRTVDASASGCGELVASVAFAVSIAVDPIRAASIPQQPAPRDAPLASDVPPSASAHVAGRGASVSTARDGYDPVDASPLGPSRELATTPAVEALRSSPGARWSFELAPIVGLGSAPSLAVGGAAALDARVGDVSLAAGARVEAQTSTSAAAGVRVSSYEWTATLLPCLHRGVLALCASGGLGALVGSTSGVAATATHSTVYATLGGRVRSALPLGERLALVAYLDVAAPLTPTTLRVDGRVAWSTSPVEGAIGVGVSMRFP